LLQDADEEGDGVAEVSEDELDREVGGVEVVASPREVVKEP
jgi:hypothetical protein